MTTGRGFDRLVSVYRLLEYAAFGRDLERARFCLLDRLAPARRILVLGEGDGRCLARLVRIASSAQIHCVDGSAAMLARAAARLSTGERSRVTFHHLDVLTSSLPPGPYDAVTTLFFLDCFTSSEVRSLVDRIDATLEAGALWIWADFRLPARGFARLRAIAWTRILYAFFRWQTRISARELPPAEEIIEAAGFSDREYRDFRGGMVRTACLRRPFRRSHAKALGTIRRVSERAE